MMAHEFVEVVQTVGFPIACVIALGAYSYKTTMRVMDLTEKVTTALTVVSDKMEELSDTIKLITERRNNSDK